MANNSTNSLDFFKASGEPPGQLSGASLMSVGAVPLFRSRGTLLNATTGVTVTPPSGLATNDIEFLVCESQDEAISLTTANGFVEVTGSPISLPSGTATIATRGALFWRRYAGQGDPITNDPGNHILAQRYAFSGCETSGDPWDFIQVSSEAVEDTSGVATGNTTLDNNRLVVFFIGSSKPDSVSTAESNSYSAPSLASVTERGDNAGNAGNGGHIAVITGELTTAGATGNLSYTKASTGYKWHFAVALKPSAGDEFRDISRSDSITVTESRLVSVGVQTNKSESITVSESIGRLMTSVASVSDGVAVSESASTQIANALAVGASDSVTVSDSVSAQIANALNIGASDTVAITESSIANVNAGGPLADLAVITNELVTVTESFTLSISTATVSLSESITLSEAVTVAMVRLIGVVDNVTVTESAVTIATVTISSSESVTVSESLTVAATRLIATSDSISVTETVTGSIGLEVSRSESITLTEAVSLVASAPQVNVSEAISVSELAIIQKDLYITTSDAITLTDAPQVSLGAYMIAVYSSVTVTDSASVSFGDVLLKFKKKAVFMTYRDKRVSVSRR